MREIGNPPMLFPHPSWLAFAFQFTKAFVTYTPSMQTNIMMRTNFKGVGGRRTAISYHTTVSNMT